MKLATLGLGDMTVAARDDGIELVEICRFADVGELLRDPAWMAIAAAADGPRHDPAVADLRNPVPAPSKIVCVGLNYRTHILEMNRGIPEHPTLFAKFADTLTGPYDDVALPAEDAAIDWEAELVIVIGKAGRRIPEAAVANYIAGYSVANDISMRTWQFRTKEWLQGKAWERTTPVGPVLVTPDELSADAAIRTTVDGSKMQSATIDDLLFPPAFLVSYISTMTTLRPGDLILTGTPGGVGRARTPAVYLRDNQVVETSIDGIGTLRNRVVADAASIP